MPRSNPLTGNQTPVKETPYSSGEWKLVECLETGMVFLENPPEYSQLVEEFAWEKTFEEERIRRRAKEPVVAFTSHLSKSVRQKMQKRERIERVAFRILSRLVNEKGIKDRITIIDVGCGTGEKLCSISSYFQEKTGILVSPVGIEISAELARETSEKLSQLGGRCVHSSAFEGLKRLENDSADLAIFCSYLEHEVEPLEVLRTATCKLKKGGYVIIKVPNFGCWNRYVRQKNWCGFRYPDHVNYFTPRTLTRMIETSGLKLWRMNLYDRLPTNDSVWAIARR